MTAAPQALRGTPPRRPAASWAAASRRGGSAAGGAAGGKSAPSGAAGGGGGPGLREPPWAGPGPAEPPRGAGRGEPVTVAFVGGAAARAPCAYLSEELAPGAVLSGVGSEGGRDLGHRPAPLVPRLDLRRREGPGRCLSAGSRPQRERRKISASPLPSSGFKAEVTPSHGFPLPGEGAPGASRLGSPQLSSAMPRAGRLPRRFFLTASKSAFA